MRNRARDARCRTPGFHQAHTEGRPHHSRHRDFRFGGGVGYTEATTLLREGLQLAEKRGLHTGWRFFVTSLLGASLSGQKKYDDAEPRLLRGYEGLVQSQAVMPPYLNAPSRITEALERLVQLYDAWGKPAQAAEWKQKLAAFQQTNKAAMKKAQQP